MARNLFCSPFRTLLEFGFPNTEPVGSVGSRLDVHDALLQRYSLLASAKQPIILTQQILQILASTSGGPQANTRQGSRDDLTVPHGAAGGRARQRDDPPRGVRGWCAGAGWRAGKAAAPLTPDS